MKTFALLAMALSAAACSSSDSGSDSDYQPTREDYDDAAQSIASSTAANGRGGDLGSMSDSVSIALGELPLGFVIDASGEIRGSRLGVQLRYSITCEDASGNSMPVCNSLTDRAAIDVAWSGQLDTPNLDASVSREGRWSVTGLQSDTAVFEGDSSFSYDAVLRSIFRPGATLTFMFDAEASYDAIALSTQTHDAISGTAELDVSARKIVSGTANDIERSFAVHAELEFHADRTASLVLDGDQRYTLDLATGVVVRVD